MNTKIQLSYEDAVKLSSLISGLDREKQAVRLHVDAVGKKIIKLYPQAQKDTKAKNEMEVTANERISIYRMVVSVMSQEEYPQKYIPWSKLISEIFGFSKQFNKIFEFDKELELSKEFNFDEEFEILNDEPNSDLVES